MHFDELTYTDAYLMSDTMKKPENNNPYTEEEVAKAVEVFKMLQKKRDELIRQGRWNPVQGCPIDPEKPKFSNSSSDDSSK